MDTRIEYISSKAELVNAIERLVMDEPTVIRFGEPGRIRTEYQFSLVTPWSQSDGARDGMIVSYEKNPKKREYHWKTKEFKAWIEVNRERLLPILWAAHRDQIARRARKLKAKDFRLLD